MVEGETSALLGNEKPDWIQRWGYETRFKYYLYRMGVLGNEGVESIRNFPDRIELNDTWHARLDEMRSESMDGSERWVAVGMKENRSLDFIPRNFVKGHRNHAVTLTAEGVSERYGIIHNIGDLHSHPSDWFNRLGVKLIVATRLVKDYEGFSDLDLYRMVDGYGLPMTGVVEKEHDYFAFRTEETRDLPAESPLTSATTFSRHWSRKFGGYYFGKSHQRFWASPQFSLKEMNRGIAEAYNLALYKGKPGCDLIREFPSIA
jgi:hypothetical protein